MAMRIELEDVEDVEEDLSICWQSGRLVISLFEASDFYQAELGSVAIPYEIVKAIFMWLIEQGTFAEG